MTTPKHVKEIVKNTPGLNPNGKGGGSVSQYKKEYCEMLVEHMSKGYSFSSFGADINKGRETLRRWVEEYPEFAEAKSVGIEKAKKYFETMLNLKLRGESTRGFDPKKSDTACLIFALKTRFRDEYSERLDITSNDEKIETVINFIKK